MSVQQVTGNPRTVEEARAFVRHVESLFMPWNVDGLVAGFTEDCVVRFGDLPEFRGRAELEKFFRGRAARQRNYQLRKQLKAFSGDTIANTWEGEWTDAQSGTKMVGYGVEVWTMRGGRIAVWQAAFNFKPVGKPSAMRIV